MGNQKATCHRAGSEKLFPTIQPPGWPHVQKSAADLTRYVGCVSRAACVYSVGWGGWGGGGCHVSRYFYSEMKPTLAVAR